MEPFVHTHTATISYPDGTAEVLTLFRFEDEDGEVGYYTQLDWQQYEGPAFRERASGIWSVTSYPSGTTYTVLPV